VIEDIVGYNMFGIQNDIIMPHRLILYMAIFKAHHISINLFLNFFYYFVERLSSSLFLVFSSPSLQGFVELMNIMPQNL
jgi:hypothetical protein